MTAMHRDTLRVGHTLLKGRAEDAFVRRRAVSSAYYSLFQALCDVVAQGLSRAHPDSDEYRRAFRLLDHSQCRKNLKQSLEFKIDLGVPFEQLQDVRQCADYSSAPHPDASMSKSGEVFSYGEAHIFCRKAEVALLYLDGLLLDARTRLLVTLVVKERP